MACCVSFILFKTKLCSDNTVTIRSDHEACCCCLPFTVHLLSQPNFSHFSYISQSNCSNVCPLCSESRPSLAVFTDQFEPSDNPVKEYQISACSYDAWACQFLQTGVFTLQKMIKDLFTHPSSQVKSSQVYLYGFIQSRTMAQWACFRPTTATKPNISEKIRKRNFF